MNYTGSTPWQKDKTKLNFPELRNNLTTDVAIVGGGITGVIAAYLLSKSGKSVALFEKDTIGAGATAYTTAFITRVIDTDLSELENLFGRKTAKQIWNSQQDAVDTIEKIVKKEKIQCEFIRCSNYDYANQAKEFESLESEYVLIRSFGFKAKLHTSKNFNNFNNYGALETPQQAKFNATKFIDSLIQTATKNGVKVFEHSEITALENNKQVLLKTSKSSITVNDVFVATYLPFHNPLEIFAKKGEYASYELELKIAKGIIPEGMYNDLNNPYHYFRIDPQKTHDRMIIGGEDHRVEIPIDSKKNFNALQKYVKQLLGKQKYTIVNQWNGPIIETIDGLALIGKIKPHEYIATGFSGNGMTYSVIAAEIFKDSIFKNKNPNIKIYNPKRLPSPKTLLKKGIDYSEEFIGGAVKNIVST